MEIKLKNICTLSKWTLFQNGNVDIQLGLEGISHLKSGFHYK